MRINGCILPDSSPPGVDGTPAASLTQTSDGCCLLLLGNHSAECDHKYLYIFPLAVCVHRGDEIVLIPSAQCSEAPFRCVWVVAVGLPRSGPEAAWSLSSFDRRPLQACAITCPCSKAAGRFVIGSFTCELIAATDAKVIDKLSSDSPF